MQTSNVEPNGSDGGCVGFSRKHHGFLVSKLCEGMQRSDADPHGSDGGWKNEGQNPNTADASTFNCMCPSRHLSSWNCMRSFLHTLPRPGLRIKTCLSHNFGIIINYYSQGLKPPSLAPLSNLSAPYSLPTLWKLSPPSLFLHGRSARNDFFILLMFCIITYTKTGSWPLTLRLSSPTNT
jgi:hypothetical protein